MIFLAALIGFAFGHLVHLVFDRFFSGEPLRGPFYECPACRSPITATSAIPYATIVLSGGRCPKCGEKLPWRAVILPAGESNNRDMGASLHTTIELAATLAIASTAVWSFAKVAPSLGIIDHPGGRKAHGQGTGGGRSAR